MTLPVFPPGGQLGRSPEGGPGRGAGEDAFLRHQRQRRLLRVPGVECGGGLRRLARQVARDDAVVAALTGPNGFYAALSPEDLSPLEADVLVWVSNDAVPNLAALPMRHTLVAHREGREVFAGVLAAAAISFGSVLSLPFALEMLEADIAAAADGRPETPAASAVVAGLAP